MPRAAKFEAVTFYVNCPYCSMAQVSPDQLYEHSEYVWTPDNVKALRDRQGGLPVVECDCCHREFHVATRTAQVLK